MTNLTTQEKTCQFIYLQPVIHSHNQNTSLIEDTEFHMLYSIFSNNPSANPSTSDQSAVHNQLWEFWESGVTQAVSL